MLEKYLLLIKRGGVRLLAWSVAIAAGLTVGAIPLAIYYSAKHNHWTAIAAVAGLGALVFAFIATFLAALAYIGSTQRPVLAFDRFGISTVSFVGNGYQWWLALALRNTGTVAARSIAVRVTISGAVFDQASEGWRSVNQNVVQWDGGADSIIHPGWTGPVPELNAAVTPFLRSDTVTALIEVVADRSGTVSEEHTVEILPAATPPPPHVVTPNAR